MHVLEKMFSLEAGGLILGQGSQCGDSQLSETRQEVI